MSEPNDGVEPGLRPVDWALRYAAAGLSVVPIARDGTKQPPRGQAWKHLQERIADEEEIRRTFAGDPGIAIINGKVSGNLETLDIDAPELVEPFEELARELAPGLLERLPTIATPRNNGGGRHFRYRIEGAVAGNTKLALSELRPQYKNDGSPDIDPRTGKQRMAPETLIETRGEGGYAIVPGSPASCHESGVPYRHVAGPDLTKIPIISAEDHRFLWRIAKSFNRYVDSRDVSDGPVGWHNDAPGSEFNATASWDEILVPAGWSQERAGNGLIFWRRPGKARGISATTGVRSSSGTELLCVFSTNAFPFEGPANGRPCSSYSKFAAYAILNHEGDFSAAAKDLSSQGFGAPPKPRRTLIARTPQILIPEPFRPFPTNVLPSHCAEYVRQAATSIDCDESMVALPLLTALAAALGNSCRIQLKRDYSEPAVVWAAVVSESGTRKSAALEGPILPLRKKESEELKKFKWEQEIYERELQEYRTVKRCKKTGNNDEAGETLTEPKRPVCRRYTVSDVTTEAIAVRLEQNPRGLLLVRDELSGFFNCMNQYKSGGKGGDEAAYLAMHGGRSLIIDRKNTEKPQIYVPQAALSIVGAIQPGVLRRVLTRDRMESGMAARFLMAYPPPKRVRWTEKSIETIVQDRLATTFDWLIGLPLNIDVETNEPIPLLLPLTPEAKPLWIAFHDEQSAEQAELHGDLSAAWAKLTGYAARLGLVCEMAAWASGGDYEPPTSVSATSITAGVTLARWFSAETKRIYVLLNESEELRQVRELVDYVRQQNGVVTARQLTRGPRRFRSNPELAQEELQRLVNLNLGTWINQGTGERGGRPTQAFQLTEQNPGDETSKKPANVEVSSPRLGSFPAKNQEDHSVTQIVPQKGKSEHFARSQKQALSVPREAFVTSREMDFFSEKELTHQTGHAVEEWPLVIAKELIDNALDACEDQDLPPEIVVTADEAGLRVSDNGPGLPETTLQGTLDFSVRVSSREAYVAPDRGAQGNALKTLAAMPYVIDSEEGKFLVITLGTRHEIRVFADPISQRPKVRHETSPSAKSGTTIGIEWSPQVDRDGDVLWPFGQSFCRATTIDLPNGSAFWWKVSRSSIPRPQSRSTGSTKGEPGRPLPPNGPNGNRLSPQIPIGMAWSIWSA